MTAQSSAIKTGGTFFKFLPYYLSRVRYLRSQLIMSIVFGLLSYPLVGAFLIPVCDAMNKYGDLKLRNENVITMSTEESAILSNASEVMNQTSQSLLVAIVIACLCLVGMFIFTFVTTLRSFRYLYSKTVVDMDYSLPVNHNTRFLGDLAAVFTANILPHLVSVLIGLLLLNFCRITSSYYNDFTAYLEIFSQAAFTGLFACIMQIGICLLMLSFCGRKAEAYIYPILVNFAIPMIHMLGRDIIESGVYGAVNGTYDMSSYYSLSATSPLGMIFMTVYSWCSTISYNGETSTIAQAPVLRPEYGIPALLMTLACLAGAYFLIKHRRAERVGMSYVYKGMDVIIPGVVILAIVMPVCYNIITQLRSTNQTYYVTGYSESIDIPSLIFGTIITTFILYTIMELISGKNFRRFWKSVLKWAGTVSASVGICILLNVANISGSYYVPEASGVQEVNVTFLTSRGDSNFTEDYFRITAQKGDDLLSVVEQTHHEILDAGLIPADDECYINFIYSMTNGSGIQRSYSVSSELFDRLRDAATTPEGWFSSDLYQIQLTLNKMNFDNRISLNEVTYNINAGGDTIGQLLNAIKEDCKVITPEFVKNESQWKESNIYLDFSSSDRSTTNHLVIYDWMENTISLLSDWGIDILGEYDPANFNTAFIIGQQSFGIDMLFALSDGMSISECEEKIGYVEEALRFAKMNTDDPELTEIAEKCVSMMNNQDYYLILTRATSLEEYLDGRNSGYVMYGIPVEYNELAEKLLSENMVEINHE